MQYEDGLSKEYCISRDDKHIFPTIHSHKTLFSQFTFGCNSVNTCAMHAGRELQLLEFDILSIHTILYNGGIFHGFLSKNKKFVFLKQFKTGGLIVLTKELVKNSCKGRFLPNLK